MGYEVKLTSDTSHEDYHCVVHNERKHRELFHGTREVCEDWAWMMNKARYEREQEESRQMNQAGK